VSLIPLAVRLDASLPANVPGVADPVQGQLVLNYVGAQARAVGG
jgi:hypothetical protein